MFGINNLEYRVHICDICIGEIYCFAKQLSVTDIAYVKLLSNNFWTVIYCNIMCIIIMALIKYK